MQTIGERLQLLMDRAGLKQAELSRRVGVSRATVSSWMNGTIKTISHEHLVTLGKVFGVDPEYISGGKQVTRINREGIDAENHAELDQRLCDTVGKLLDDQKEELIEIAEGMVSKNRQMFDELMKKFS